MSRVTANFEKLLDSQERTCGERLTATVGAVTADAVVGELRADKLFVAGGKAESGGFEIQMRKSDFATPPAEHATVIAKGRTLKVLSFDESHGVYAIRAGDPATESTD